MGRLTLHFFYRKPFSFDPIFGIETAVPALIIAMVGQVHGRIQLYRMAELPRGNILGFLRHILEMVF
jgi:hypothetical protein